MKARVTTKGQVTIPKNIRDRAKIRSGTQMDVEVDSDGAVIMRARTKDISELKGIVKVKRRKPLSLSAMKKAMQRGFVERQDQRWKRYNDVTIEEEKEKTRSSSIVTSLYHFHR